MSRIDMMSSIKRNLGLQSDIKVADKRVAGMARLMTRFEIHTLMICLLT